MMDQEEEKRVTIQPLEAEVSEAPKKRGRPRKYPPKERIETHAATPSRLRALEKARAVKLAKKHEREKAVAALIQTKLTAPAESTQGYHYGPAPDMDASLVKSHQQFVQPQYQPMAYYPPYAYNLEQDSRLSRIETLLGQLSAIAPEPQSASIPQNIPPEPSNGIEQHKNTVFNTNPFLSRRYGHR